MIGTIEFELPEEQNEFEMAVSVHKFASASCEIDSKMRNVLKHGNLENFTVDSLAQWVRDELSEVMGLIN